MINVLKSFAAKMWLAFILIIILIGMFLGGARLLLPIATEYREEVQELASRELGQRVEIKKIKTGWRGYGPELRLLNVQLINPKTERTVLRLPEVRIGIGILDSLFHGAITPREITFYRTQLLIQGRPDGSVALAGLEEIEHGSDDSSEVFFLPFRIGMKESEIHWENQRIGADPIIFKDVDFTISNAANRHQVKASMRLSGKSTGSMHLIADIKGAIQESNAWSGDIYLSGDNLTLSTILKDYISEDIEFKSGSATIELWSKWINGRLFTLDGNAGLDQIELTSNANTSREIQQPLEISHAEGRFQWKRNPDSWNLDVTDFTMQRNGQTWPTSSYSLQHKLDQQGNSYLLSGMEFLRLQDLIPAAKTLFSPSPKIEAILQSIKPKADIHSLQLKLHLDRENPTWSAHGQLKNGSTEPWQKLPRINNLNTEFWINQERGALALNSTDFTIDFPNLFGDPISSKKLEGQLQWSKNSDGDWLVHSKRITANNSDINTQTRLRLQIPSDLKQSPILDLQTDFDNGRASATKHYLPTGIMDDEVVAWLDKSIISGKVIQGSAIFRGRLDDFPFHNNTGHFEVLFDVEDLVLDYQPGWPRIQQLAAEVRFHNNSFYVREGSGTMLNSRLRNLYARIDDLENTSPLKITGSATGPLSDELKILTETPLAKKFGETAARLSANGNGQLEVKLAIPIRKGDYDITGNLRLDKATLNLDNSKYPLTNTSGKLTFNMDGVSAKGVKSTIMGENIRLDIAPKKKSGKTLIKASSSLSGAKLNKQFPTFGLDQLQGKSKWTLQLEVPSLDKNRGKLAINRIVASSDLVGTAIEMPAPIGKTKKQQKPIKIITTLESGPKQQLSIDYANVINASLQFVNNGKTELERGSLIFGGGKAQLPKENLLILSGKLNKLNLNPWLNYFKSEAKTKRPQIAGSNLQFGTLKLGDTELNRVALSFTESAKGIAADIKSSIMDGKVQISLPINSKPIVANLNKLSLKLNSSDISQTAKKGLSSTEPANPRDLPALSLSSKNTLINGKNLGPLNFVSTKIPEGLRLDKIKLTSKRLALDAKGSWIKKGKTTQTNIKMNVQTDSLGKLLQTLGFDPKLKQAPATVNANLVWSGNPRQFNKTDVTGQLDLSIGKGRLLKVNPGLGRILGLLNVSALTRRLTMDFSDTFKKGFSFDKAEGAFNLENGDAYTNDFIIEGPAGTIEITGRTGLVSQDFDQLVTINPAISTTIPVAGALAGGPAVGVALIVAQKIFGKAVDKVSTSKYTVTGSWDNPSIEKLNINIQNPNPADPIPIRP
jgi:uncharacterized protein (TIGR02099 family)